MGIDYLILSNNQFPFFYSPIFSGFVSCGVIFIITGFILLKNPPKQINSLYVYCTKTSMKNQKVWDYAQLYSSTLMITQGLILIILSCIGLIYFPDKEIALMLTFIWIILSALCHVFLVDSNLRKKFRNYNIALIKLESIYFTFANLIN